MGFEMQLEKIRPKEIRKQQRCTLTYDKLATVTKSKSV